MSEQLSLKRISLTHDVPENLQVVRILGLSLCETRAHAGQKLRFELWPRDEAETRKAWQATLSEDERELCFELRMSPRPATMFPRDQLGQPLLPFLWLPQTRQGEIMVRFS